MTDYCKVGDCGEPGEWCDKHATQHETAEWNKAIEAAALKCELADVPIDIAVWAGSKKELSAATAAGLARIIRSLKREAK